MQAASDPAMLRTPLNEFLEDDECPLEAYQAIDDADVLKAIIEYEAIETPSKFLAVEKIVRQIIEDGGKVVIWATFIHTIHSIKEYLESKGIQCQELYGAIPVEKEGTIDDGEEQILTREKIVRAFQDDNCPFKVMDCFWCEVASGELKLLEAEAARWLTKEELDSVQWLPADVTLIDKIRKCME